MDSINALVIMPFTHTYKKENLLYVSRADLNCRFLAV